MTATILNLSAYCFAPLTDLENWRTRFLALCESCPVFGTVILSPEGANFNIAGQPAAAERFRTGLADMSPLNEITFKESWSQIQPFRKLQVKLKEAVIPFGAAVAVDDKNAPHLPPAVLKQWLDEGREVVLLDTRNTFEADFGTFENAQVMDLINFRDFPKVAKDLMKDWQDKPVVTFCTGGVRCEKAAPWLYEAGCKEVYQLDGGILAYFEQCGGAHYRGDCYVFDGRISVDSDLKPTGQLQCVRCNAPVEGDKSMPPPSWPWVECAQCV